MQRTFLGLTHNPFVPPQEGFYPGGDRKRHLDQLRHLSQWSRRVLAVTGPYGIGKSTIFRQLSTSLEPKTKGARLAGSLVTSEREIVLAVAQGFGVDVVGDAHVDDITAVLVEFVREQTEDGWVCMTMVDDAHQLQAAAVKRLLQIASQTELRVVFFTETGLIDTITQVAHRLELEWFEIRLSGLTQADVRSYLEWRFEQAGYKGSLPFTTVQVEKLVSRSKGNPHLVNQLASQLLGDIESGNVERHARFPTTHIVLTALIVVIVGLVYLLVQDDEPQIEVVRVDPPVQARPAQSPAQLPEERPSLSVPAETALSPELETATQTPPLSRSVESGGALQTDTSAEVTVPPPVREDEAVDLVETNASQVDESNLETGLTTEPDPQLQPETAPQREPEAEPRQPPPTSQVPVVEASQPAQSATAVALRGSDWLLKQNPSRYTLQLVTLSSFERVEALIERQADASEFAVYRTRRNDRVLYVVTYGLFSNRDAAVRAASELRGELGELNPWIRPLSMVQDAIRQSP